MPTYPTPEDVPSGVQLSNLPLVAIDLTTFTQSDPNSAVQALTYSSGINTVTYNAITGTADWTPAAGTNFIGPRWYAPLEVDGVRLTGADTFLLTVYLLQQAAAPALAFDLTAGVCVNPTSTVIGTIENFGSMATFNGTALDSGVAIKGANTTAGGVNANGGMASLLVAGGYVLGGAGGSMIGPVGDASATRNGNAAFSSSADLSLLVQLGIRGGFSAGAGDKAAFKLWYSVAKIDLSAL